MAGRDGLTRRIGIVAVGRAAGTFSILAVNAILTRSWSPAEFGLFSAVWVLGNTLVPIFLFGLPTSLLYFFPRRADQSVLVLQTFLFLVVSGGILVGVLWLAGPQLYGLLQREYAAGLAAYLPPFLPYIFSLVAGGLVEPALVAAQRHRWQALLALVTALALVGVAVWGKAADWSVGEVLAVFSCVGVVRLLAGLGLLLVAVGKPGIEERWWNWNEVGDYLRYALPIAGNDTVGVLSRSVDRLVVLSFLRVETFAFYHVGAIEVPVSLLLAAVVSVLVPEFSRLYKEQHLEEIAHLWREAIARLALVVVPLFFFLFFFADSVVAALYPEEYAKTQWIFRIFLLVLPLRIAVYNPLLVGMGKAQWALWGSMGDLALNLILSIALVAVLQMRLPHWAFAGPALATVVSTYLQVIFLVGMIRWHLQWRLRDLLPWRYLARLCAFSILAALAALFSTSWEGSAWMHLAGGAAVFGGVLTALLWSNERDRQGLKQILNSLDKA